MVGSGGTFDIFPHVVYLCQDVPPQVAQYLNLELPILEQVLLRLREEENKEIQRIVGKSVKPFKMSHNIFLTSIFFITEETVIKVTS